MKKKKWFWHCTWEQGYGIDLECCSAKGRGCVTKEKAMKAGENHLRKANHPPHTFYIHVYSRLEK